VAVAVSEGEARAFLKKMPANTAAATRTRRKDRGEEVAKEAELAINECDDWASAWEQAKAEESGWGGRGKGGRGLHRATYQPLDVHVEGVTLAYLGKDLLDRSILRLTHGRKYGLIGNNGCGKTTLLSRINQQAIPGWPLHLRTYLVQQELPESEETVLDTVIDSDDRRTRLLQEEEDLLSELSRDGAQERLEAIHQELEAIDAFSAEARAAVILLGLGFKEDQIRKPMNTFSGGWRMRAALACCLFCSPDIMLLDEAQNHLDLHGSLWLAAQLRQCKSTVLVVSHDAHFLDSVATDIILFRERGLHYYPGNHSAYLKARSDAALHLDRAEDAILRQRSHMETSIRNLEKAARAGDEKKSSQLASRKKKLERHGYEKDPHGHRFKAQTCSQTYGSAIRAGATNENALGWHKGRRTRRSIAETRDSKVSFKFPPPAALGVSTSTPVLELNDVGFSFSSSTPPLFDGLDMGITLGTKTAFLGVNGSGKSTLLRLMADAAGASLIPARFQIGTERFLPSTGQVVALNGLKIGYFSQNLSDSLLGSATPLQHMLITYPSSSEQELRSRLGSFGVGADLALKPMSSLSGGQRARVGLAEVAHGEPHLLLLDEPSNHLDMASVEALSEALCTFQGGVVLVSHNVSLIEAVSKDFWVVKSKRRCVERLPGAVPEEAFRTYIEGLKRKAEEKCKIARCPL
jgi:ATPase subunit of ABC transporter with duplicated ATPase domains